MIKSNMFKLLKAVFVICPFVFASMADSAGFALYEFSARGNAMGGAVMANKAEPASIATNPALITQLEGTQLQTGITAVIVSGSTTIGTEKRDLETGAFYLPAFFLTQQLREDVFFGLGFFPRYGLGGRYKDYETWSMGTVLREAYTVDLMTYSFNPNLAVKVTDDLSFAMGLEVMFLDFQERKHLVGGAKMDISGNSTTWGGNFGVLYNPGWAEKWAAALTYRTKTRHVATGRVKTPGLALPPAISFDGNASAALTLPDQLAFGLSFTPTNKLTMEANIMGIFWSSYSQLKIDYDDLSQSPGGPGNPPYLNENKNYKDVFRIGFGVEYSLNPTWDLRAGYVFDKSPINKKYMDTLVPADDRNIFSVGAGYNVSERMGIDVSYSYVLISDLSGRNVEKGNTVFKYEDASSHMIGLSFKYAFGNGPLSNRVI
ncbi:Membrane protein putatively involved in long-chain fatty acid transport [Elusimicrobium minutum Pei191]|uniref:Membrane protein putatively involved in long-chain fatty acid transport n=1 Tax=Elusimicrobium minutum (strain Pei191) TaxID=445932 RepID=B2KD66_ELUMP|nr:outer membrane protein transport protein [Elusimicrobium minutum]ACC98462.1 Membrane protein putatively involved in long-chain fatty acid transport [Elusimicrobium minutum Pei191]